MTPVPPAVANSKELALLPAECTEQQDKRNGASVGADGVVRAISRAWGACGKNVKSQEVLDALLSKVPFGPLIRC